MGEDDRKTPLKPKGRVRTPERAERLKRALRENLKRRREQAKKRKREGGRV